MRKFTLIELIVVIAILTILASLVIPNTKDVKQSAIRAEVLSNIQHMQTAVDIFYIDNNSQYPTIIQPTVQSPQLIDFKLLYPKYLKNLPNPSFNYWVDFSGKVWAASMNAPHNIHDEDGVLKWESSHEAIGYEVYQVKNGKRLLVGTVNKNIFVKKVNSFNNIENFRLLKQTINEEDVFLVSAIDKYGLSTAPSGTNYIPIFKPIEIEDPNALERTFFITIKSSYLTDWIAYEALEYKPEGTDIIYEFATSNDGNNYSPFTSDFSALENSNMLKIKITLRREAGKESPQVYNIRIIYKPYGTEDLQYAYIDPTQEEQTISHEGQFSDFNDTEVNVLIPVIKEANEINYTHNNGYVNIQEDSSGILIREVDLGGVYIIDKIISPGSNKVTYQTSVDGVNWSEQSAFPRYLPAGRYVRIINEIDGKSNITLQPPIIQTTSPDNAEIIQEQILDIEEIKEEWNQVDRFTVFQDATAVVKWLSMDVDAEIPEDIRLTYVFYTSTDGVNWSNPVNKIEKVGNSRYLKVDIISARKSNSKSTALPDIREIIFNYQILNGEIKENTYKNLPINAVITVNPSSPIANIPIEWSYSNSTDPNGFEIVEAEWKLNGELVDSMPTQLPKGTYEVSLRVKNSNWQWSE